MKSALISVSDKTGVESLASRLEKLGYRILSTGGTASALRKAGINVTDVSEITGFPECLDGRVKTLHPAVHGGILAMRSKPEHMEQLKKLGIDTIDIVVINLYPFKATISKKDVSLEEAIENIDIGGPTMLRAAAKNWQDVCVITDVNDYDTLIEALENGGPDKAQKFAWAQKIFEHTANYDSMIARYLAEKEGLDFPSKISFTYEKVQDLRYGENPHQKAAFYKEGLGTEGTLAAAKQLHGKELSFNNINDTAAAISMLNEFAGTPAAVAVKHANPCGVGIGDTLFEAYTRAYDSDPVSIFGGIVALNRKVDPETAKKLSEIFLEVIVAPEYSEEALAILGKKKNIRLLQLEGCGEGGYKGFDIKKIDGGLLVQSKDSLSELGDYKVVTKRAPTEKELAAMAFGWKVVKHTRSNAIVLTNDNASLGIGPGQTNRIMALELAIKYAGERAKGSVMASDAFFPFDDCVKAAHEAGITAIVQPGGSVKDEDSIKACDEYGIAMIFTGVRHFRH